MKQDATIARQRPANPRVRAGGLLAGFALGGFFDGILLHQILQWHHLLSLVEDVDSLAAQVLFDGLFHAAMYLLAVTAVGLLWREHRRSGLQGSAAALPALALLGFGAWHLADAVLSHWLLGIHRIRMDSANPLAWDLLWLALFGIVPMVAGVLLLRRCRPREGKGSAAALCLAFVLAGAGAWAARGPEDQRSALVVFAPGIGQGAAWNAARAAGGHVLWHSRGVYALRLGETGSTATLYRHGALLVGSNRSVAGCLAWTKA